MEELTGVEWVLSAIAFLSLVGIILVVWAACIRWLWMQRGIGFAQGWFEVAERRARATAVGAQPTEPSSEPGEVGYVAPFKTAPSQPPAPERAKPPPREPIRYLVPTEKK